VFPYTEVMPRPNTDPTLEVVETPAEITPEIEEKKILLKTLA
ncbi:unnamed protein product, partial [Onchocerca ochengi]